MIQWYFKKVPYFEKISIFLFREVFLTASTFRSNWPVHKMWL